MHLHIVGSDVWLHREGFFNAQWTLEFLDVHWAVVWIFLVWAKANYYCQSKGESSLLNFYGQELLLVTPSQPQEAIARVHLSWGAGPLLPDGWAHPMWSLAFQQQSVKFGTQTDCSAWILQDWNTALYLRLKEREKFNATDQQIIPA